MRLLARAALGALAALALSAPGALGDADPASDILLGANVFYPYSPTVSATLQRALNAVTAAAHRAHFPIRVALIESASDLGAIPSLFDRPQTYARFLYQEIAYYDGRPPLLVVMPDGYGAQGIPAAALASLKAPLGPRSDALAQAAIDAVPALSAAAGHPIHDLADLPGASQTDGGGASPLAAVLLLGAAAVVAAAILAARRRWATQAPRSRRSRSGRR